MSESATATNAKERLSTSTRSSRKSSWLSSLGSRHRSQDKSGGDGSDSKVSPQPSPKAATVSPTFLISTLKRIASSSHSSNLGGGRGVAGQSNGSVQVERRVMNRNPSRKNCAIKGVNSQNLKRVAFYLDVEYADTLAPSQTAQTVVMKVRKPKRRITAIESKDGPKAHSNTSEGPAKAAAGHDPARGPQLVNVPVGHETPHAVSLESESGENLDLANPGQALIDVGTTGKEGNVNKLHIENATQPEKTSDGEPGSTSARAKHKLHKRPKLTECAKMYRRCCQLRETSPRKDVNSKLVHTPHRFLPVLDLTAYRFTLSEINCLSDFLAIIPVRNLILDECDLTDEGLRVILASLLSVSKSGRRESPVDHPTDSTQPSLINHRGSVEKLSLRKNTQISEIGWRNIGCFVNMSWYLKSLDISSVPFPTTSYKQRTEFDHDEHFLARTFSEAIKSRLSGNGLEYLNLNGCSIPTRSLLQIVTGATESHIQALGLAGNEIRGEAIISGICTWLESGGRALDLSDIDITGDIDALLLSIQKGNSLFALALRNCNLRPPLLAGILQSLSSLPDLRLLDLSSNKYLASSAASSVSLLVTHLPKFPFLKRLHLDDLSLSFQHVIALSEIIASSPRLAHVSLKNNNLSGTSLTDSQSDSDENKAAMFTALITAVRVSPTMVSVEVDLPGGEASAFLQAQALKLISLCLRNIERGAVTDWMEMEVFNGRSEPSSYSTYVEEATAKLNRDGLKLADCESDEMYNDHFTDMDGTGLAKALDVCLASTKEEIFDVKLATLSENLLRRAEAIREKLRPALCRIIKRDSRVDNHYQKRLEFILQTIESHIERFKVESPDHDTDQSETIAGGGDVAISLLVEDDEMSTKDPNKSSNIGDSDDDDDDSLQNGISAASKDLVNEEGQMHRIGHFISQGFKLLDDNQHPGDVSEMELEKLKAEAADISGCDIRKSILSEGPAMLISQIDKDLSETS